MRTIVVGAGIAGLWVAEQLALLGDTVTVLERADYLGGRVLTSDLGFEIGAGRIATTHSRVLGLVRRLGLTTYTHGTGQLWKALGDEHSHPNIFHEIWAPIFRVISRMEKHVLSTHTLRDLATKVLGPAMTDRILIQFGYRAETDVLRADLGVYAFDHTMGAEARFVGVKGGIGQVIERLAARCRDLGVRIQMNTQVTDVTGTYIVHTIADPPFPCDRVVLALPSEALKKLPCMRSFRPLRHLAMEPLTRIYAKFATPWPFKERIVTDSLLRYIIPIVPELGIVMISYVESQDTHPFMGLSGITLTAVLQRELTRLFPTVSLPLILWAHAYEWAHGCSYWLPGNYNPLTESRRALRPFPKSQPRLHLCNESFSLDQAWMEGSLAHAEALLELISDN